MHVYQLLLSIVDCNTNQVRFRSLLRSLSAQSPVLRSEKILGPLYVLHHTTEWNINDLQEWNALGILKIWQFALSYLWCTIMTLWFKMSGAHEMDWYSCSPAWNHVRAFQMLSTWMFSYPVLYDTTTRSLYVTKFMGSYVAIERENDGMRWEVPGHGFLHSRFCAGWVWSRQGSLTQQNVHRRRRTSPQKIARRCCSCLEGASLST